MGRCEGAGATADDMAKARLWDGKVLGPTRAGLNLHEATPSVPPVVVVRRTVVAAGAGRAVAVL